MKNKTFSILLIVLFVFSTLSVQAFPTASQSDIVADQKTTITQSQQPSLQTEEVAQEQDYSSDFQQMQNPISSQSGPDIPNYDLYNPFDSTGQPEIPDSFQTRFENNQLSPGLFPWSEIKNDLSTQGISIPESFSYNDHSLLHYDSKGIEYIISTTDGKISSELVAVMADYGVTMEKSYPNKNFHVVNVPIANIEDFVLTASQLTEVTLVEPNYYAQTTYIPNDPSYSELYGMQIIGMETAWDIELGSTDVLVAVIDTGIDYNHPDLGNYLPLGYDHYNGDNDPWDDNGHGTHVAGTIGATINNALGVAGVANVSFFAEKFLDEFGFGSAADGAAAIMHAVDAGADILSNSWGGYGYSQVIADAVDYATANGVIVTAAAGNGATSDLHYPAALPDVISISATNQADNLAGFSNYGDWIDIAAPGVDILSTLPSDNYGYYSGTSMATPHVSGLLALLMSAYPEYSPTQVENLLYSTATDLGDPGFDPYFGWGRIDASTAIFGIQEHDLRAEISVPSTVPNGDEMVVEYGVTNLGLSNETNVQVNLTDGQGTLLDAVTISSLNAGSSSFFQLNLGVLPLGTYEYNVSVMPVTNETVFENNVAIATSTVSDPIIFPETGDILRYGLRGDTSPFDFSWEVMNATDPTAVVIGEYGYDPEFDEVYFFGEHTLNTFTREFSSYWDLFPYWINPNVSIGDTIDLFSSGGQEGLVVNETTIDIHGYSFEVWIVDDGYELILFDKYSGVLLSVDDYSNNPLFQIEATNILQESIHNTAIALDNYPVGAPGTEVFIDVFLYNTGEFEDDLFVELFVNGQYITDTVQYMYPFSWTTVSLSFIPEDYGTYNVSINSYTPSGELDTSDNLIETTVNVVDLENYQLSNPAYRDYDAVANGYNLDMWGDDISSSVQLPFNFEFYDGTFDTIYISSNGWMSFVDETPTDYYPDGIPSENYPYMIAPFFSDLIAEGNVYAWTTPDFVVIEYVDYYYLWGDILGTFELVLFDDGSILFQYEYINYEDFNAKGLNYGINLNYYTIIPDNLGGVTNYAGLFTLDSVSPPPPTESGPDLAAGLTYPQLHPNESEFITASVENTGTTVMYDVQLFLSIDGSLVGQTFTQQLAVGDSLEYNYLWMNMEYGNHTIEVQVVEQENEVDWSNNYISEVVFVSDEHDLWVGLNIFESDGNYYIDASVYNSGFVTERNVELYLLIDGQVVTFGIIEELAVGTGSVVSYAFIDPTTGSYNITAYAPLIDPELDESNNVATQFINVEAPQPDTFVLQLFDNETLDPISNAYVYLYSYNSGNDYQGYTNSSGGLTMEVPADEYYLYIDAEEYFTVNTNIVVDGLSYFEFYLERIVAEEQLVILLTDNVTGEYIPDAWVYLYGLNTGYFVSARTNATGAVDLMLPLDEYNLQIEASGYEIYRDIIYVEGLTVQEIALTPLVFDSQLILSVLDNDTLEPVVDAWVNLFGLNTGYHVSIRTNESGIIDVVLPTDEYEIYINEPAYQEYSDYLFISGFVYYEVYLTSYVFDSTLQIQVVDATTSVAIRDAYVDIYGTTTGYWAYNITDSDGFAYFLVPGDDYSIFVQAPGYESTDLFVSVFGNVSIVVELQSAGESSEEITITSPVDGDYFETGHIIVEYNTTYQLQNLQVYLNGTYLFDTTLLNGQIVVPIFGEAMWEIELVASFYDGMTSDTVIIQSGPLENTLDIEVGDSISIVLDYDGTNESRILTFTVSEFLTDSIVYFETNFTTVIDGVASSTQGYIVVSLLNGYIIDSDTSWSFYHYYPLYYALNWDDGVLSDNFAMTLLWGNPVYFNGSEIIDGYEIINFYDPDSDFTMSYYAETGALYGIEIEGITVTVTTTLIPSQSPPELTSPEDQIIEYGSNHSIVWYVNNTDGANYSITINGTTLEPGVVVNNTVRVDLSGLGIGNYTIELTVWDVQTGLTVSDEVFVLVQDTTAPVINTESKDFEIFEGENLTIIIEAEDLNPGQYYVYLNSSLHGNESWQGNVSYIFGNLSSGYYEIIFEFVDTSGNSATVLFTAEVIAPDTTAPQVRGPVDFTYEVGALNNFIEWQVTEESNSSYVVYHNNATFASGTVEGDSIEIQIDGLLEGRHNFTVVVTDYFGNTSTDTVIVYVIPIDEVPPTNDRLNGFTSLLGLFALLSMGIILRKRRLN